MIIECEIPNDLIEAQDKRKVEEYLRSQGMKLDREVATFERFDHSTYLRKVFARGTALECFEPIED